MTWIPRTSREGLIQTDTILAGIVPTITATRERIAELTPGHSGRPAGNGEPGGGKGASGPSVVERTAGKVSVERRDLDELDRLTSSVVERACLLANNAGYRIPEPQGSPARRLALTRWAIRLLIDAGANPPSKWCERLHQDTIRLADIIDHWNPHQPTTRSPALAQDDTEQWCRSHLRIGNRTPRDSRYPKHGLCRWCGDFNGEQGFLPTLDILDAHETGSSLAVARALRDGRKKRPRPTRKKTA